MLTTLISFLGGNAFRMLWGELSSWLGKRQEHAQEIERLRLQAELDAAQHARTMEIQRLQADLGIKTLRVQSEAEVHAAEAQAWAHAVSHSDQRSGTAWVDAWNGMIRPLVATVCIVLWVLHVSRAGWVLDEQGWAILGAALGIYLADRTLTKRGK